MAMRLNTLRAANNMRQAKWKGAEKADITFRALELCGETGEVAEAVKKIVRHDRDITGNADEVTRVVLEENLRDEIGDVLISLDLLAREFDFDLSECVSTKFNKTSYKHGNPIRLQEVGLSARYVILDLDDEDHRA